MVENMGYGRDGELLDYSHSPKAVAEQRMQFKVPCTETFQEMQDMVYLLELSEGCGFRCRGCPQRTITLCSTLRGPFHNVKVAPVSTSSR